MTLRKSFCCEIETVATTFGFGWKIEKMPAWLGVANADRGGCEGGGGDDLCEGLHGLSPFDLCGRWRPRRSMKLNMRPGPVPPQ